MITPQLDWTHIAAKEAIRVNRLYPVPAFQSLLDLHQGLTPLRIQNGTTIYPFMPDRNLAVKPIPFPPPEVRCVQCNRPFQINMPYDTPPDMIFTDGSSKMNADGRIYVGMGIHCPAHNIRIA